MQQNVLPQMTSTTSDLAKLKGRVEPRLWTKPLRELTPETSYGYKVIEFAEKWLKLPLDPWQQWLVIHMGELLENGKPRFTRVLILVARQNGKTHLLMVLALYWQFIERHKLTLGMNASMEDAKEALLDAYDVAVVNQYLAPLIRNVVKGNTAVKLNSKEGPVYRAVAATEKGGRGKRIDRLIVDELRLHRDWKSYSSAVPAMGARNKENPLGTQAIFITNQGDDNAVVLDSLRKTALEFIDNGAGSKSLGLFEWSAPDGCDFKKPENWEWANPSLNLRLGYETLHDAAMLALNGPAEEAYFRTEHLSQKVRALDPAVDANKWNACYVSELDWTGLAKHSALFLDIAGSQKRATLVAAYPMPDGKLQVGVLKQWVDENAMSQLEADLQAILTNSRPRAFGWMPIGPAASKATLKNLKAPGVAIEQFTGEVADACMVFADLVRDEMIVHGSASEDLLSKQVTAAAKKHQGDRWRFARQGAQECDAAFAAAGAVLLARSLPAKKTARLIGPDDGEEDE